MANFCFKCGHPVTPSAKFCPKCGVALQNAYTPDPRTAQPHNAQPRNAQPRNAQPQNTQPKNAQPVYATPKARPSAAQPPKKKKKRFTALLLVAVLIFGFWYTGYRHPGFMIKDEDPWAGIPGTDWVANVLKPEESSADTVAWGSGSAYTAQKPADEITQALSHSVYDAVDWEEVDYSALASQPVEEFSSNPADCALRFDASAVSSAPVQTAEVSPDSPVADFGEIRVDFKAWNLDNETDTLSVCSLGEISEGEDGWSIIGYDFSLASGQDTFDTNVEITIPRTAGDGEAGTCVTFNEETGQWEDLYASVSEDGRSYVIKTDHFSFKGERKLNYVYSGGSIHANTEGQTIVIDEGLFYERYNPKKGTRMQSYVLADRNILWAMYLAKNENTLNELFASIQELKSPDINALQHAAADENDAASLFIGTAGGLDNLNTLLGSVGYNAPFVGDFLTAADVALNLLNVQIKAIESNKPFWEALAEGIEKNKEALGSTILSTVMTTAATAAWGNWVGALVGVMIWGGTYLADKAMEPEAWDVTDTPGWEDLYKVFYLTSGAKVTCGSKKAKEAAANNEYTYAIMEKPESFTDKQWAAVAAVVNKKPLRVKEVEDEENGGYTYEFTNFAPAFTKIIEMFYNDPYKMERAIDDFYEAYADAMWNLPDKSLYNFAKAQCELGAGEAYFKEEFVTAAGDILRPLDEDIEVWRADMVSLTRARTAEQLEEALDKALNNTYSTITDNMYRLEKLLNTTLYFHVVDETLLPGQTFRDSIYFVDWQKIPENKPYLPKNNKDHSGGYDDPELVVPMRFVCGEPHFKPLDGVKGDDGKTVTVSIPYTEYYPFVPDFLPRVKTTQTDDVVYTCTLYHYLMMGAPTQMLFKDCSDPKHYAEIEGVTVDIEFPKITGEDATADVYVRVNSGNEIGVLEGMWSPAPNGHKYAKKEAGTVSFVVSEGGKLNTFIGNLESKKSCGFQEGSSYADSRFVYTRNAKKEGEKQTGILTIWKPNGDPVEDRIAFTVEEVEKGVIYLKEWDLYLLKYDPGAGGYALKINRDPLLGEVAIPDGRIEIKEDGTLILEVAAVVNAQKSQTGNGVTTTYTYNRSAFTIQAKKGHQPDIPYGYDDAVGRVYTVTSVTDITAGTHRVTEKTQNGEPVQETTDTNVTLHSPKIARGEEEEAVCSDVVVYYDCKDPTKLRFVQFHVMGLKDEKRSSNGAEGKTFPNMDSTYYMQLDNR